MLLVRAILLISALLLGARVAWAAEGGVGDVYVTVGEGGGLIYLDGATTGIVAPGVVRAVPEGVHTIRVDDGCKTGAADVTVRTNAVERVTLKLETGTGTVRVTSNPPETVVTEGGRDVGTGSFGPISVACGSHTFVGTAPGRQTLPYTVEVPLRGHVDVNFELPLAALGGIAITPTPLEATILVDGIERGTGPMTVEGLPAGVHRVGARMDGYLPAEAEVNVVPYQIVRSTLELALEPPPKPLRERLGLDRVRWGRVGVNIGVSALSIGLGALSFLQYDAAATNYETYTGLTYADDPAGYYASEVDAPRTMSYVLAGTAGASAVTAGVLWATTTPKPVATPAGTTLGAAAPGSAAPAPAVAPATPPATPTPTPPAPTPGAPNLDAAPLLELGLLATPGGVVLTGRF